MLRYRITASVVSPGFYEGEIKQATDFESPQRIKDLLEMGAIKVHKKSSVANVDDEVDYEAFGMTAPEPSEDVDEDVEDDSEEVEEDSEEETEESEDETEPASGSDAVIEAKRKSRSRKAQ